MKLYFFTFEANRRYFPYIFFTLKDAPMCELFNAEYKKDTNKRPPKFP